MRAEAQAYADKINDALALLRRFLDWDRALRRLDELNARVEDPTLWEDPKAAQDVMRGKPSEIDHLNGLVVRRGEALGVPTPVNRTLHVLVKLQEVRLDNSHESARR